MRLWLAKLRDALADSFWFLPALMAILAGAGAVGSVALDHAVGESWMRDIGWIWSGSADGARSVLSTVAGSVMTIVSIVFSLTLSTLAQTSSHYGPRVLRNFTSDRGNQFVLGTFIATFIYCLLVLRTVRSAENSRFVPFLSVNIGVALALASLAVLIYFIHHISQSIQAENLIAEVGRDFQRSVPRLFPEHVGEAGGERPPPAEAWREAHVVEAAGTGYLQEVDDEQLLEVARRHDLQLKLERRPGDFVSREAPLLLALPADRLSKRAERDLVACFVWGKHRTPHQDALYSVQQLVEIACHALSPGINEPFTAMTCIDWLGSSLRQVARREMPSPHRHDAGGRMRVIARPLSFDELARAAFGPIRLYGNSNPDVLARLLEVIEEIAPHLRRDEDRASLARMARLIALDAAEIKNQDDRERVARGVQRALRVLAEEHLEVGVAST